MVRRIGAIRNTARKNVPGNRYLKGMKRLVEYRMKIPTAASSSTASHIQDCWETSTGARKTVTARVVPSTSTRAITAGTRSEEHTSELQFTWTTRMTSYACKKKSYSY